MKLQRDKVLHILAGLILCLAIGWLTDKTVGLLVAVGAGVAKEIYDKHNKGTVDVKDSLATTVGGLAGYIILNL